MVGWVVLGVLLALVLAAPRYGADTRTAGNWTEGGRQRPAPPSGPTLRGDLRAVGAAVSRFVRRLETVAVRPPVSPVREHC